MSSLRNVLLVIGAALALGVIALLFEIRSMKGDLETEKAKGHQMAFLQFNSTKPDQIVVPYAGIQVPVYDANGNEIGWKSWRSCVVRPGGIFSKLENSYESDFNYYDYEAPLDVEPQKGDCETGMVFRLENDIIDFWLRTHRAALQGKGI